MKRHLAAFTALALLFLFPFVSCEKQTFLFQNGSKMKAKIIGLVVSSASSGISGVESDAKRLIPEGNFYGTSLWINSSNHGKRATLVKEWLEKNNIKDIDSHE